MRFSANPSSLDLTDATAAGRALLTAANAAAQLSLLGLAPIGTSAGNLFAQGSALSASTINATGTAAFAAMTSTGGLAISGGGLQNTAGTSLAGTTIATTNTTVPLTVSATSANNTVVLNHTGNYNGLQLNSQTGTEAGVIAVSNTVGGTLDRCFYFLANTANNAARSTRFVRYNGTLLLDGMFSSAGRFILNSATDDGANQFQVTGDSRFNGNAIHYGNMLVDITGTTTSTPRLMGATSGSANGNALRCSVGDANIGFQGCAGGRMQMFAYHGITVHGARGTTPPAFDVTGPGSTDYGMRVLSSVMANVPFAVQGVSGQTGDLSRWLDGSNNTVAKISASGTATFSGLVLSLFTPASSTAAGVAGTFAIDANYLYACTAINNWKRSALSTF